MSPCPYEEMVFYRRWCTGTRCTGGNRRSLPRCRPGPPPLSTRRWASCRPPSGTTSGCGRRRGLGRAPPRPSPPSGYRTQVPDYTVIHLVAEYHSSILYILCDVPRYIGTYSTAVQVVSGFHSSRYTPHSVYCYIQSIYIITEYHSMIHSARCTYMYISPPYTRVPYGYSTLYVYNWP
jgi:hypothetical protein